MIGQRELTLEDYKEILKRRVWLLVIPAILCAMGAYVMSKFLPSRYTSETTVLVEEQRVPEELVRSVVGGDLNQRLATMQEQILSRTRLQHIIETFGLYKEDRARVSMEELIVRLRKSITISPVRAMAGTGGGGLPGFTVSVTASQAQLAQQICTEITSIFMQQNVLFREHRAEDTTEFLTKQLQDAKAKLDEQDAKVADFQRRYMGELPDEMQQNFSMLSGLSSQLEATNQALNRAQQDRVFIESTLSQQLAIAKTSTGGESPDLLSGHLASLQSQLAALQARYTDEHPDVIKLKSDIAQLQKRIQDQNEAAAKNSAPVKSDKDPGGVETPQVQQLRAQLHQIDASIKERSAAQARIQQEISRIQARLQLSPTIAQEYKALTRDYQTAYEIYNDLLRKQNTSKISTDLERRQQGEQFRVLDPPSLPQKPTFPNRPFFALGGLLGGLALGAGIAFVLEAQDTTLRSDRDIEIFLKLPTLAIIPEVAVEKGSRANFIGRAIGVKSGERSNLQIGA